MSRGRQLTAVIIPITLREEGGGLSPAEQVRGVSAKL